MNDTGQHTCSGRPSDLASHGCVVKIAVKPQSVLVIHDALYEELPIDAGDDHDAIHSRSESTRCQCAAAAESTSTLTCAS